jgi:hypothetical protein
MAEGVSITVVGIPAIQRELVRMRSAATDMTPVFRGPITKSLDRFFRRQWDTGGKKGERGGWRPLARSTIRAKQRARRGQMGILRFAGRLRSSFIRRTGPDTVNIITPHSLERGSLERKAWWHQEGTRTIPARPIIPDPMPTHLVRAWERLMLAHIVGERRGLI